MQFVLLYLFYNYFKASSVKKETKHTKNGSAVA